MNRGRIFSDWWICLFLKNLPMQSGFRWPASSWPSHPVTQSHSHGILQNHRLGVDPFSKFLPSFRHGVGIYMASLVPPPIAVRDLYRWLSGDGFKMRQNEAPCFCISRRRVEVAEWNTSSVFWGAVNFDSHYPHDMLRNWNGSLARSVPWNYSSLGSDLDLTTGRHWQRAVVKFERLHQPRPPQGYVYVQCMFFAQKDTDHFSGSKPYLVWLAFLPSRTPKGVSVSVDNPNYLSSWFHCFFFWAKWPAQYISYCTPGDVG